MDRNYKFELQELIRINWNLEYNSLQEKDDYDFALNQIYEYFEYSKHLRFLYNDFLLDENGQEKNNKLQDYIKFYNHIYTVLYNYLIEQIYTKTIEV